MSFFSALLKKRNTRELWKKMLLQLADPVLKNLAQGTLKKNIPSFHTKCMPFAPLEAFGRLTCGMGPWLDLTFTSPKEREREREREREYGTLFLKALDSATDPQSPDFMIFTNEYNKIRQPLVDTAFLCQGLLRAPNLTAEICKNTALKHQLVQALRSAREIEPWPNNWLLFSAMVETGLYLLGEDYDEKKIDNCIFKLLDWYKGDSIYGDGILFHFDYYNSFVIHPMLLDIVLNFSDRYQNIQNNIISRAKRYAVIQERMISPEGYYPFVGRSLVYRTGAFHLLAQVSLRHMLEETLQPAQVRCACTAVMKHFFSGSQNFDRNNWLIPGLYGRQEDLAESYINTGSLYLCSTIFLPLGLPQSDPFWAAPDCEWTSQKIISGKNLSADKSIKN
ncbi:DUF2264 domain-containing protein [Mailhella sp.]